MKNFIISLALLCLLANGTLAQTQFSPEVKRVAVFKNGYAFTFREGEAQTKNGWVYTTNTPIGVLGSVWGYANAPANARVVQLLASETERRETQRVVDLAEILLANEGTRIRFTDNYNANKTYEGTYEIVGGNRNFEATGEGASLRLFSLIVPASEVFEWTLEDAADAQNRYMNSGGSYPNQQVLQDLSGKIWSALRLKNQTEMPWTTAPALSFREWKPLGQDMLTFTAVGGENILRVTPATEVVGRHTLEEKSRAPVQLKYSGGIYNFDLITVEGAIKIRNAKRETVELVLTRNVVGEVLAATDGGVITKAGLNLQSFNTNSIVKWNLSVPSGGEREIRYTYKIYIRR